MVKKNRKQRKTLLVVGEGDCEVAFLQYLRNIYCSGHQGLAVTIRNAQGGGPLSILNQALRHMRLAHYDKKIILLDTDIAWPLELTSIAKKNNIWMLGSIPCLEGLLLRILKKKISKSSKVCKKDLQKLTKADMTQWKHYEAIFSKEHLDEARASIEELDNLLVHFEER